jgi:predicted heme/steroid binding protein
MRSSTQEELSQHSDRDGVPPYVAHEGKVYDVSGSFLWRGGRHQASHRAGQDLTGQLGRAPHGADRPERFPVVGELQQE